MRPTMIWPTERLRSAAAHFAFAVENIEKNRRGS
jgi:hypothetical protein